jgi:hypothetical protein
MLVRRGYRRARSFGKLGLKRAPNLVSVRSTADQSCAEKAGSEWIEGSSGENNRFSSCETHPKTLSGRQKENRGCRTPTLG